MTMRQVYRQAVLLPPAERARLVDLLLSDLDKSDPLIEKAWTDEVSRRAVQIRAGQAKLVPYEKVMGKYR